ncbi:DUF6587 family protein [Duganella fentianensis]|uniref:DUF6587 family protein n=1 Tax=Duganella fentianensis TaxID=2692177 RepID=UPI001926AC4A|nr:DUF6587 family protein [Duganella fentianensis]
MLQNLIVAVIVVLALLHVCRRYLPAALRRGWANALAQRGVSAVLLARLFGVREGCGDGCGSCGGCDSGPQGKGGSTSAGAAGQGGSGASGKPSARVIMLHVQR